MNKTRLAALMLVFAATPVVLPAQIAPDPVPTPEQPPAPTPTTSPASPDLTPTPESAPTPAAVATPSPVATPEVAPTREQTLEEKFAGEMQAAAIAQEMIIAAHHGEWNDPDVVAMRTIYRDIAGRYPKKADPHVALGDFLTQAGFLSEANAELAVALQLEPGRSDLLAARSNLLLKSGDTVESTNAMEEAVARSPADPALHYALAHLYFLFRQDLASARSQTEAAFFELAMQHYRRATELSPANLNYAQTYAETFYTIPHPDWSLALLAWGRTLVLSPDKSFVQAHLVRVNIRLKNKPEAQRNLALITDPAFAPMKKALQNQIDRL